MKFLYPKKGSNLDQRKNSSIYGNYPLSSYNTWHGGTHEETRLAPLVAISDARIIAYKLPSEYLFTAHECPEMYSNGFILLQHDYKSPKEKELTFYSLYHHIASKFDIAHNKLEVPSFLSKKVTKIKASNTPKGVRGRAALLEEGKTRGAETVLIPKNHIVTRNGAELLADWAKTYNTGKTSEKKKYYSYTYTDPFTNTVYSDIHIYSGCLQLVSGETDKYKVTYDTDTNTTTGKSKKQTDALNAELEDGALLYNIAASDFGSLSKGTCIGVIPKDTEITVIEGSESEDKKWVKVKDSEKEYEGYLQARDFEAQKTFDSDIELDKIVACDIPVKAGEIVAYVGAFGFNKNENNYSSHIELFTDASDTDVSDLLDNCAGDGEENFQRYKMLSGATLEPYVQSSKELKAGTPIRVTSTKGDYVRVKVKGLIKEIDKSKHLAAQQTTNASGKKVYVKDSVCGMSKTRYKIKDTSFDYVNQQFNGLLTKGDFVYYYKPLAGSLREIIIQPPFWNKEFWIDKSHLKVEGDQVVTFGLETTLESDSCHTYIGEPYTPHERGNTFKKERELSGKPQITVTDDDGKLWCFIAESYDFEKECYQHIGWIKADDAHLELINPFVWSNFGFKTYDAGSEYVYAMKDYHKSEKTDVFIDELWKMVDEDGDGILSPIEFLRAQRNPYTSERMGKMVVKHKSEWSYEPEAIKSEALEFYKLGLDLEKDSNKKKLLEQKRDTELGHLVTKTKNLMFWTELQNTTYTPKTTEKDKEYEEKKKAIEEKYNRFSVDGEHSEECQSFIDANMDALDQEYKKGKYKEEETRKLPSSDMLWHFNMNSFVRQMRLIYPQDHSCETLIWGNKVSCEFRNKVIQIANNLWGEKKKIEMANNLMAVFAWESGEKFKSDVPNMGNSGGTGLIQFMPSTAKELLGKEITIETIDNYWGKGKSLKRVKEFAEMSDIDQLDYVEKYFKKLKNKDVEFVDFYLQVLYPASMGKPDGHIVFSKDGTGLIKTDKNYKGRIRAYKQNSGFDTNKAYGNNDGQVSKAEIKKGVQKYLTKGEDHKNNCKNGCDYSNTITEIKNSDLKITEGLNWASSIAIKESQLRKDANTKYLVDYKQESGKDAHNRVDWTEEGIKKMDCSELVCRYLQKVEWSKDVKWLNTSGLLKYAKKHPDKLEENKGNPKVGDIFVWNGHTGIIKKYTASSKKVLTIESISEKSYSWHEGIHFKGVVEWLYEKDKNHLKNNIKTGKNIYYFTPKKHYSK